MARFFPSLTATRLQATTYLLGIALFSISFLVFLNSSISFVVTDVIGQNHSVGDAVGSLGFADELLALVACPLWGLLSDRIGVRSVAVIGYVIVGVSLVGLVQSRNVYPELLVGRLGFSLGGAACSTMVTAVLPAMVANREDDDAGTNGHGVVGHAARFRSRDDEEQRLGRGGSVGHAATPSVSSELTITPNRYASRSRSRVGVGGDEDGREGGKGRAGHVDGEDNSAGASQLAGFVGFFTGCGALVALAIFLPLPARFQDQGQSQAQAVQTSFYIVGAVAICVAIFIFLGLRNLPGEEGKSISALWQTPYDEDNDLTASGHLHTTLTPAPSYFRLVADATKLGFTDSRIGLGYLGGFVARASSVGISLFIPLFVNAYFVRTGLCTSNPDNLTDIKENCQRAYTLASALTGIAETAALICAPLFGWLGGRLVRGHAEWPLLGAAIVGIGGYIAFGFLRKPDPFHGEGGQWAILAVILIGISQIGSIVCSLGLLSRGISGSSPKETKARSRKRSNTAATLRPNHTEPGDGAIIQGSETAPLLPSLQPANDDDVDENAEASAEDRTRLKGSIAGVYSFAGGAGILLLTKLGGALFDSWHVGAPFFLMAVFNAVLAVAILGVSAGEGLWRRVRGR